MSTDHNVAASLSLAATVSLLDTVTDIYPGLLYASGAGYNWEVKGY